LERVAAEVGRSMAQVAINWVAHRPGVASILLGATKLAQLEDNLAALDFELPAELRNRLDTASAPVTRFPYTFFTPGMQSMLTGGALVGDKPPGYAPPQLIDAKPAGVTVE
jgi:diketogulonate reductase-like aldo/keto reductase